MFSHFDKYWLVTDEGTEGRTDGQTDGHRTYSIYRASIASRGKTSFNIFTARSELREVLFLAL